MGAGLLTVKTGFILFIKNYQFPIQINTLEREVYHIVTQLLYQHGHVPEKGGNVLKTMSTTFVTHQRPSRYSLLQDT
jgi:hypothetical protein